MSNPEFLREGTAVQDYMNPPLTLIGTDSEIAEEKFRELYKDIPGEFISTDIGVAEMMKYVDNTYHGLKIVFANEVGNICKALGIDSHKVMEIFCKDKQLNISPYYFKPGFAYGGSCLPKDSKALRTLAHDLYVDCPVINAINPSNELQKKNGSDVNEVYKMGDVFSTPGHIGLAMNEALFWGLPVVLLEGTHAPEIYYMKNGTTGYLAKDEEDFKKYMVDLLHDEERLSKMSKACLEVYDKEVSIDRMFQGFKDAIEYCKKGG